MAFTVLLKELRVWNLIILSVLLVMSMIVPAQNSNKQKAIDAVKRFFQINDQKLIFEGHFVETDPQFGEACRVNVDFSRPGNEYLTIVGEFTPAGNIGDGIYFKEDENTFLQTELSNDLLTLEQKITDSFSTSIKTWLVLTKNSDTLRFSLYRQTRFLFISDVVEKKCVINNYKPVNNAGD